MRSRLYYIRHRDDPAFRNRIAEKSQRWRKRNPDKARRIALAYRHGHIEKVREWQRNFHRLNPEKNRQYRRKLRAEVIAAYGGRCTCCGESQLPFLVLDHVNGGGTKERREIGVIGPYHKAKREGFPPRYRILCANCNHARAYGECPHGGQ